MNVKGISSYNYAFKGEGDVTTAKKPINKKAAIGGAVAAAAVVAGTTALALKGKKISGEKGIKKLFPNIAKGAKAVFDAAKELASKGVAKVKGIFHKGEKAAQDVAETIVE